MESKLKLRATFLNQIITDEKDINDKLFWDYFKHQRPLFLVKLFKAKNQQRVNNINDALIYLREGIIGKQIPENESPKKINIVYIV